VAKPILSGWTVTQVDGAICVPLPVPGDVHSALLNAGEITDPYWRDTEPTLDWVHESDWEAVTQFDITLNTEQRYFITFDCIDCHVVVKLNDQTVGYAHSQFLRWDFDVTEFVISGNNELSVLFRSNSQTAAAKAAASEIVTPPTKNNRLPHFNYLRKTACHAGWDWNIALSPLGIYGEVYLRELKTVKLNDVLLRQCFSGESVRLEVELSFDVFTACEVPMKVGVSGATSATNLQVYPGENNYTLELNIKQPQLWWPVGEGAQTTHNLSILVGDEERLIPVGFRHIELDTTADEDGRGFAFIINGRKLFMRGANWIPADALPANATPDVVRDLLTSAIEANMNMLRVWGGGQYEADWFYELCTELGILVWQDFMFACNLYPAHDREWLKLVKVEAQQQVRRLSKHPCVALWCGDNELVGALNWYPESQQDRDRYLAIYDRLNHTLEEVVDEARLDIPFWSSSPSIGRLNFGDGWHDDSSGDMHFWDVWHEAKDFEHYRTVRPRFCSEFGFQSFPSMAVIERFTEPADRTVSSAVMQIHQRNEGGNERIVETMQRYFNVPESFAERVYLSQLSHGLAMKTAIEYWRSCKPRCMGTLYWQLNDTWPVASWASLEHGGGWKCTQYLARRFFQPVLLTAQPDQRTGEICLFAVNDTQTEVSLTITVQVVNTSGPVESLAQTSVVAHHACATEVMRIPPDQIRSNQFLYFSWSDASDLHSGYNEFLPLRPKEYELGKPVIDVSVEGRGRDRRITLSCDRPALCVTVDHGGDCVYSDNCLTLLPDEPRILTVLRERTGVNRLITAENIWSLQG